MCVMGFLIEPYHDWQSAKLSGGSTDDVESNSLNTLTSQLPKGSTHFLLRKKVCLENPVNRHHVPWLASVNCM